MTYSAVEPQPTTWEQKKVGGTEQVINTKTVGDPKPPSFPDQFVAASSNKELIYSELISVDELRVKRLIKQRKVFGLATLMILAALLAVLGFGLPYEPLAALLFCVMGIFVVFAMKVHDAQR